MADLLELRELPEGTLVYHYTSAAKLAMILHSGHLRLSPYARTRDPRENQQWYPRGTYAPERPSETRSYEEVDDLMSRLDAAIRRRAKIACLTLDRRDPWPHVDRAVRGYARPRMWEQYADNHRGAVLVFDHGAFGRALSMQLEGKGRVLQGPVEYGDYDERRLNAYEIQLGETVVAPDGLTTVADAMIDQHHRAFFFWKNTDWASEQEYRYVVMTDEEYEEVDITGSLVALVLGEDFPAHDREVLKFRLRRRSFKDVPIHQMYWHNGVPNYWPDGANLG